MNDGPFELPARWRWATFSEVARVAADLVDPTLTPDTPHIAPNHIESWTGALLPYKTIREDGMTSAKHRFHKGQILYSKIRPYLAKAALASFDGLCSADMYPIETDLDPSFLLRWMLTPTFTNEASGAQGRTVLPKINRDALGRLRVPVAPLNEQRRIVAKLDAIFEQTRAAKTRLERLPALLDKLKRSILAAAFSGDLTADWRHAHPNVEPASVLLDRIRADRRARWEAAVRAKGKDPSKAKHDEPSSLDEADLRELPPTWAWSPAGSVLESIEAGRSPKAHGRPANADEFGVLKVSAVTWGRFLPLENKALVAGDVAEPELLVRRGDLLITRANTVELVGAVVLVEDDYPNLMLSDKTLRLVPVATIDRAFLLYALRTADVRRVFEDDATGTSDSMRNITQDKIRAAPIALAPVDEQREIARRLDESFAALDALRERVDHGALRASDLERAALAKAFRGELVDQDPADEPAAALLERIRTAAEHAATTNGTKPTRAAKRTRAKARATTAESET